MAYETYDPTAPESQTDVTQALVRKIPHNPWHPLATTIYWPDGYDQLVNPTNDQMSPVNVEDEVHPATSIRTGESNALYLQHKPRFKSPITVSTGTPSSIDYTHGVIHFSEPLPTGEITVQYLAEPDKYFGEYIGTLQNVIHRLEVILGAGGSLNEGLRNAEFFLDSLPAAISSRLPHAIHVRAIDRDIEIRSSTDPGSPNGTFHRITLGNSADEVFIDASRVVIRRSTAIGPEPTYVTTRIGDSTGDELQVSGIARLTGPLYVGTPGTSANPAITDPVVTGFEGTGLPYTSGSLKAAIHGDTVIYGDLHVLGQQITYNTQVNVQVNTFQENLDVFNDSFLRGDTRLGSDSTKTVYVGGDQVITGELKVLGAGGKPMKVDTSIVFTDGGLKGPYEQGLIDGLDPSYMEMIRPLMRSSYRTQWHNDAQRNTLHSGTTTSTGPAYELIDTSVAALTGNYPSGTYYQGKFDDGDFVALITNGDGAGQRIPIKSFDPATSKWTLARSIDGLAGTGIGLTYVIAHEKATGNFVQAAAGLNVSIKASSLWPFVGNANGTVKLRLTDYTLLLPANSTSYIFMSTQVGVNGIDQDAPTFFSSASPVEDERSVLIGKAVTDGSSVTAVTCYDINGQYDTLWVHHDSAASGNTRQAGTDWTIGAKVGNLRKSRAGRVVVQKTPVLTGSMGVYPDTANVEEVGLDASGVRVKKITGEDVTVTTPGSGPYFLRVTVL